MNIDLEFKYYKYGYLNINLGDKYIKKIKFRKTVLTFELL